MSFSNYANAWLAQVETWRKKGQKLTQNGNIKVVGREVL
jgi:hypothetical protein